MTNLKRDMFEQAMNDKTAMYLGECLQLDRDGVHLRLESAAHRSKAGAGAPGDLLRLPADAGAGVV